MSKTRSDLQLSAVTLTIFDLSLTNTLHLIDKVNNLITLCEIHKRANQQINANVSSKTYLQKVSRRYYLVFRVSRILLKIILHNNGILYPNTARLRRPRLENMTALTLTLQRSSTWPSALLNYNLAQSWQLSPFADSFVPCRLVIKSQRRWNGETNAKVMATGLARPPNVKSWNPGVDINFARRRRCVSSRLRRRSARGRTPVSRSVDSWIDI